MIRFLILLAIVPLAAIARDAGFDSPFMVRVWQSGDGLPGNVARSVGQTADGQLWIATAEGVARFDGFHFETIPVASEWQGRPISYFRIFTPADGSLWVSTHRDGLLKFADGKLNPVASTIMDQGRQRYLGRVTSLFTHKGKTYFYWDYRYCRFENGVAEPVLNPDAELAAVFAAQEEENRKRGRGNENLGPQRLVDRNGGFWNIEELRLSYQAPDSRKPIIGARLFDNPPAILDMLEDREGNLWMASAVEGIVRVQQRRVKPLQTNGGPYRGATYTALQDREKGWWIANRNGQVDRIRRNGEVSHHRFVTGNQARSVACIFEDSKSRVWFGTGNQTLMRWDEDTNAFVVGFPNHPEFSKIKAIAEDSKQRLWFAGIRNLIRVNGSQIENFRDRPLLKEADFTALAFDSRDNLIAGTANGRVISYDGSDFKLLGDFTGYPRSWISAIVPTGQDEIWVTTIGAGLMLWKNGAWHRFGLDQGLPDERLTGLAITGEDFLCMGSLGGIIQASREDLLRHLTTKDHLPRWKQFGRSDGLPTRECVGGVQPGVIRDHEGTLWFPTLDGIAGVKPEESPETPPPLLHLRMIEVNGASWPVESVPIKVGPGRVRLGFEYVGIDLSAPEKVSYRVQLNGLDETPLWVGGDRRVNYQAVPPGRYSFEVTAVNGDGIASARAIRIPIEVRPHFWQTVWFIGLAIAGSLLTALAIGWIVARSRMKRKLQEIRIKGALEDERSRISRDLHDDIGASLTELSILSELIAEDESNKETRDEIGQLSLKAKMAVGSLDEIVWATNPTQDSLKSLVEYLAFFVEDYLRTVKVPLRTELPETIPDAVIGPRRRHSILLASREAVNNAVKHAHPGRIELGVSIQADNLVVSIRDDGRGFSVEYADSGNGLTNLRRRMTDCGGDCRIESHPGQGTTVTLTLPLKT